MPWPRGTPTHNARFLSAGKAGAQVCVLGRLSPTISRRAAGSAPPSGAGPLGRRPAPAWRPPCPPGPAVPIPTRLSGPNGEQVQVRSVGHRLAARGEGKERAPPLPVKRFFFALCANGAPGAPPAPCARPPGRSRGCLLASVSALRRSATPRGGCGVRCGGARRKASGRRGAARPLSPPLRRGGGTGPASPPAASQPFTRSHHPADLPPCMALTPKSPTSAPLKPQNGKTGATKKGDSFFFSSQASQHAAFLSFFF